MNNDVILSDDEQETPRTLGAIVAQPSDWDGEGPTTPDLVARLCMGGMIETDRIENPLTRE